MKRILCAVLLLCLLTGCSESSGRTWAERSDGGGPETAAIAYIPLDDRPVNTERVALLAQSAGFRLVMPDESLYRTALDGQLLNPNGKPYGDGNALLQWLTETDADYYAISVDQILSGGLVNSRHMCQITDEFQQIDRLLEALAGKPVILFDTVMRLAPTVGYGGHTLAEYEALRAYGRLPRPILSGELTADRVIAGYEVPTALDAASVSGYLAARSRKLRLAEHLLLSQGENTLLFYGIDDSSPENTVQTNEIAFLEQKLSNGHIFAGTDELGLMAVTRLICDHYGSPGVSIRYFGADPKAPADAYDTSSLEGSIAGHLAALGAAADPANPHLSLLVFGGNDPAGLLACYRENLQNNIPTMVVDLGADFCLPEAMLAQEAMDLRCLLSYSAWNTAGNSIGIALSNGIARYLYLRHSAGPVAGANSAFIRGLALSFAKDVSYASIQLRLTGPDQAEALRLVQAGSGLCFDHFAKMLAGKAFLTSLSPAQTGTMPRLSVTGLSFPWGRTFEANLEIEIE